MKLSQSEMDAIEDIEYDWLVHNELQGCKGVCRLGPCMCSQVIHRNPSDRLRYDVQLTRDASGKIKRKARSVIACYPIGKDDHIWNKTPAEVIASTYAWIKEMHMEIEAGKERRRNNLADGEPIPQELLPTPWTKADDDYWLKR